MPLFKNEIYNLSPLPKDLKDDEELFVIPETKECFRSYDEYVAKLFLYRSQHWSCRYTGRSSLTYKDALLSEKGALKQLETIPDCFKEPLLRCIHKAEGNVKVNVEKCVKFLTNHYCLNEDVVIVNSKNGKQCPGVIINVLKPSKEMDVNIEMEGKENEGMNANKTQVSVWKYHVQLAGNDVILKDVLPDELKRKTKLPSKELLTMFIKYSAERLSVNGKDMWIVKNDLVKKYDLPAVPNSSLTEQKNQLRNPLDTISGQNGNNTPRQKTKKIYPKDPRQRTLNFFVQTPKATVKNCSTPTKESSTKKMKGSPVVPKLQICLTPNSKVKEVVQKLTATKGSGCSTEGKTARSLFDVKQDAPEVLDKNEQISKILISDKDETFLAKMTNTNNENDINLKEKDVGNTKKVTKKRVIVVLDDNIKETKIIRKNAVKKQKTLSQMFKASSSKLPDDQQSKTNAVIGSSRKQPKEGNVEEALDEANEAERCVDKVSSKNDFRKEKELPSVKTLEITRLPLPCPKAVSVPEQLRTHYGDVLMITEFVSHYGDFLGQDKELRFSSDDLLLGLTNSGPKTEIFASILIGFLQVLLKDLRRQDCLKEFADLGVDLVDMTLSKSTVGEMSRLYLQNVHGSENPSTETRKELLTARMLDQSILLDLNRKDIVDLGPVQKLEVLTYLLDQILVSEAFNCHQQELEENRRQACKKKTDLEIEIKKLVRERKEFEKGKKPQKEIVVFLEKSSENSEEMAVDEKEPSDCEQLQGNETKDKLEGREMESSGNDDEKKDENATSCSLTKRQEMVAKSKVEKEKCDEVRRFGEQIYQKRQKLERCKEVIKQVKECRRSEFLGRDRYHSRYWLLSSYSALLVEKKPSPEMKAMDCPDDVVKEDLKDDEMETLSERSWFYYNTREEIDHLISSLDCTHDNEDALKQKLKMLRKETKKLQFQKRPTELEESKLFSEKENVDHLESVKVEICDLGNRITEGHLGRVNKLEAWTDEVMSRSSLADLVTSALHLADAVKIQSLWKKLGDREEWLNEDWAQAVKESMTSSRLRFCIAMLDYCIMWDRSPAHMKCKICRRVGGLMTACDKCRKGFHIFCLRPALNDIPDEEWLCPVCSPDAEHRTRRAAATRYAPEEDKESQEETENQEENDDHCDVCGGEGELICCDTCPKVYHKGCHDPPLRNIPRGVWKCCSCHGRQPTARKRSLLVESEEFSDLETSQDESADDSSYSESEDSEDSEDAATIKRDERAKRREQMRIREEAKTKRKDEKARRTSRKRKRSPSPPNACLTARRKPRQNSEFKMCESLLKDLMHHEDSWPFTDPVDISEVPDYLEVVSRPMDFGTIKRKLNAFEYSSYEECISDIKLVFANSDQYNLDTSDHGLAGISLEAYFREILLNYFPKYELQKLPKTTSRLTRSQKRRC